MDAKPLTGEDPCPDCSHPMRRHSTVMGAEIMRAQALEPVGCIDVPEGHDPMLCTHSCNCQRTYTPEARRTAGRI